MLSWWQWALLAAVPPAIVLLYFLKLQPHSRCEVPSTYLWRKSIEDLHVNSIWQRLRPSLLAVVATAAGGVGHAGAAAAGLAAAAS